MARKKNTGMVKKAIRHLYVSLPEGDSYIDIARCLSIVNRKLFPQGMVYGIQSCDFTFNPVDPNLVTSVRVTAQTAGDSWSVHNAHVKGHALWNEMNQLVLEDNPSVSGKWADYKVFLDLNHRNATVSEILLPKDGSLNAYLPGEWNYSTYTMPQHDVDPATGNPLPADITNVHILGGDLGTPGALSSIGLVKAYQQSRATVFDNNPNVAAGFADSFFNKLTDSGSQEPELALEIEFQNDDSPYDLDNYPGGQTNGPMPIMTEFAAASVGSPVGTLNSFVAQCGLIKFTASSEGTYPGVLLRIDVMPGSFQGVAAIPMGQ
jgi:hypothetical protein